MNAIKRLVFIICMPVCLMSAMEAPGAASYADKVVQNIKDVLVLLSQWKQEAKTLEDAQRLAVLKDEVIKIIGKISVDFDTHEAIDVLKIVKQHLDKEKITVNGKHILITALAPDIAEPLGYIQFSINELEAIENAMKEIYKAWLYGGHRLIQAVRHAIKTGAVTPLYLFRKFYSENPKRTAADDAFVVNILKDYLKEEAALHPTKQLLAAIATCEKIQSDKEQAEKEFQEQRAREEEEQRRAEPESPENIEARQEALEFKEFLKEKLNQAGFKTNNRFEIYEFDISDESLGLMRQEGQKIDEELPHIATLGRIIRILKRLTSGR